MSQRLHPAIASPGADNLQTNPYITALGDSDDDRLLL
jgi:hypothetical protein